MIKKESSIGEFIDEKREYIIKNMYPKRPLKNYLWNDTTFVQLDQFGFGFTKACIDNEFRIIANDVRLIYIKDRDSGCIFDVNRNLKKLPYSSFFCRVGLGYHTIESEYDGVKSAFTIMIPESGYLETYKLTLKNTSEKVKRLSVYPYVRPFVNINGHLSYGKGWYDENFAGLYYTFQAFNVKQKYLDVYFKSSEIPSAYSTNDADFIGFYGSLESPVGLENERLGNENTVFESNYCGVMQFDVELAPNEEKTWYFALGIAKDMAESTTIASEYVKADTFERELCRQKEISNQYIQAVSVDTPDEYINSMTNIWLKRQISLGKTWGRVYGKGFRDLLQDITGFVSFDSKRAKERLLYTLKHQFISGNGLRQFDPILDYPYQDMPVWIPIAVLAYIKESGDFSVLEESVGYYDSEIRESVFAHIKRGIDFLYSNQGAHGLGLWRGGDWNDSMNNCGMQGKGESVWLSIATLKATDDYIEILKNSPINDANELVEDIKIKQVALKENIIKYGFETDHFIYGINDWNEKVGSYENEEGRMYLNPQTWAVMAKIFDEKGLNALMDHVENNLKCEYGYMQNVPSYTKPDPHIGRVAYFGAGLYENGSVYNHGVMFKMVADCLLGRGDNAYETLKLIAYDNPKNANSGVEPYAISNMYFGPYAFARKGYAPRSWITGSAGWLYRALTEFMLGVQADFDGLIINPVLPTSWKYAKIERTFRNVRYDIEIHRGNKCGLFVDGKAVEGNKVPILENGTTHKVEYWY